MTHKHTTPSRQSAKPAKEAVADGDRESFDPSGPYGGFGGAGGSQGSVYGDAQARTSGGPSEQRLEHEAWQRDPRQDKHGGVIAGEQGPYGDYGEIQEHHGGYWYGGREGADKKGKDASPPAKRK